MWLRVTGVSPIRTGETPVPLSPQTMEIHRLFQAFSTSGLSNATGADGQIEKSFQTGGWAITSVQYRIENS